MKFKHWKTLKDREETPKCDQSHRECSSSIVMSSCPWMSRRMMLKLPVEGWIEQLDLSKHWEEGSKEGLSQPMYHWWQGIQCQWDRDQHSPGKAAQIWQHACYPLHTDDRMECNLCVYVQRLEATTGSNRTCCPAMENREGCLRKMAWQSAQEGQAHSFSTACSKERDYCWGEAGRNRGREIRSPDVCSVYKVSESFGNKIEISHTINSDTCARSPHLLKTEVVLCDLKQN